MDRIRTMMCRRTLYQLPLDTELWHQTLNRKEGDVIVLRLRGKGEGQARVIGAISLSITCFQHCHARAEKTTDSGVEVLGW